MHMYVGVYACVYVLHFVDVYIFVCSISFKSYSVPKVTKKNLYKLIGSKMNNNIQGIWVIELIKVTANIRNLRRNVNALVQSHTNSQDIKTEQFYQ